MNKQIFYVCDICGEKFTKESECRQHEFGHKSSEWSKKIRFFEKKQDKLVELPLACKSVDECDVIYCDGTDEVWNTLDEAFDLRGYSCVSKDIRADGHIFVYDHDAYEWFCLEKKLDYFVKLNAEVNKIIEGK